MRAEDVRIPVTTLSVLALLQAAIVVLSGGGLATALIAVNLAIASAFVRLPILVILAVLIVINFAAHVAGLTPPFPCRLAHVAVFAMYGATALAGLAALLPRVRFAPALAGASLLAFGIVTGEALIPRIIPASILAQSEVRWTVGPQPDPVLGEVYAPYATMQTVYPDNPRGYFDERRLGPAESSSPVRYSVGYSLNALGCRGDDYQIPKPRERYRILVLGGSSAFGAGVREEDTFAEALQRSLQTSGDQRYDVINCAVPGYSTHQQRVFFEQIASRYQPDVVVVGMSDRDDLSRLDVQRLGYVHLNRSYERMFLSVRLIQYARHEGRRPFDYSGAVDELAKLNDACRVRGARLAVMVFRNDVSLHWQNLVATVTGRLPALGVPVVDLGLALLKDHTPTELAVHPLDGSPNEIAHRAAADAIARLLSRDHLIGSVRLSLAALPQRHGSPTADGYFGQGPQ